MPASAVSCLRWLAGTARRSPDASSPAVGAHARIASAADARATRSRPAVAEHRVEPLDPGLGYRPRWAGSRGVPRSLPNTSSSCGYDGHQVLGAGPGLAGQHDRPARRSPGARPGPGIAPGARRASPRKARPGWLTSSLLDSLGAGPCPMRYDGLVHGEVARGQHHVVASDLVEHVQPLGAHLAVAHHRHLTERDAPVRAQLRAPAGCDVGRRRDRRQPHHPGSEGRGHRHRVGVGPPTGELSTTPPMASSPSSTARSAEDPSWALSTNLDTPAALASTSVSGSWLWRGARLGAECTWKSTIPSITLTVLAPRGLAVARAAP